VSLALLLGVGLVPLAGASTALAATGAGPTAVAGPDQAVDEGSVVHLDGSGSTASAEPTLAAASSTGTLPGGTSLGVHLDGLDTSSGGLRVRGSAAVGQGTGARATSLAYVIDVSASTDLVTGCGGDQNLDGRDDSVLDCEIAAAVELNQEAVASGTVDRVSLVQFSSAASPVDLDPTDGTATLVSPSADADQDGVPDVVQALRRLRSNGATNFVEPARTTCELLAPSTADNRLAAFMSDGQGTGDLSTVVPCSPAVTFQTFAVGTDSTCTGGNPGTRLADLASYTGGVCTSVRGVVDLPELVPTVLATRLDGVALRVDDRAPVDLGVAPVAGPAGLPVTADLPADLGDGNHRVCLVATGRDSGGTGAQSACSDLVVTSGRPTYAWRVVSATGPAISLSSASSAQPSFTAPDDGSYVLALTVTDGAGRSSTDEVGVHVSNVAPTVQATVGDAYVGGVTRLTGSFADAGVLDVHSAVVDWGDGTTDTVPPTSESGGAGSIVATHTYQSGGSFAVGLRLLDDDGGSATASLGAVAVRAPVAVWARSSSLKASFDWTGGSGSIDGRVHTNGLLRFQGAAKVVRGTTTYAGAVAADTTRNSFTPAPALTTQQDFPFAPRVADYRPGGVVAAQLGSAYHDVSSDCSAGAWTGPAMLAAGAYYASCDIRLAGSQVGGQVTLVSEGHVKVSGSRPTFEAYHDGVLLLAGAAGEKAIDVSTSGSTFHGTLFAGSGEIDVSGSTNGFECGLLGDTVDISGSGVAIRSGLCGTPR
jgi:hypothetical protein